MRNLSSDSHKLNDKKDEFDKCFFKKDKEFHQIKVTLRHVSKVVCEYTDYGKLVMDKGFIRLLKTTE